ncbi:MAG: bifunctional diaminohydroxyphosphoribosylaminopyrimidine deaminase/5-amino-6-(5-phosphoribosylamino)uracil reductase RibD [Bacteroidota bacterium]
MKTSDDIRFMRRCFDLAQKGSGSVSPNPMVGCVIVRNGLIVGEGYHRKFGGPHAEVYALRDAGASARNSTVYVNLEPCSHYGRTPPCAEALIKAGVKEVVLAVKDPNPFVFGGGIRALKKAGIHVRSGILHADAERLNEKFFYWMKHRLPFAAVKVGQTMDGRIADVHGRSKWITSEEARRQVHRIRANFDAVLVGARTVKTDDPELTVRYGKGHSPLRIVLDGSMTSSIRRKIFRTAHARTMLLCSSIALHTHVHKAALLERQGVDVVAIGKSPGLHPASILKFLASEGISSLLIEGGAETIASFLQINAIQKIYCFTAPKILGSGLPAFLLPARPLDKALSFKDASLTAFGDDYLFEGSL